MSPPEFMQWKLLYYWVLAGKWRRWCIPGAIFSIAAFILLSFLQFALKDYPVAVEIVKSIVRFLLQPISFLVQFEFFREPVFGFSIVFGWFALIGAIAGAIARILWQLVKRKPQSDNCYILEKEKVE